VSYFFAFFSRGSKTMRSKMPWRAWLTISMPDDAVYHRRQNTKAKQARDSSTH
jgi:hypothetical protein